MWRSPVTGEVVGPTTAGVAPQGPRGLWKALVAATAEPAIDLTGDEPVIEPEARLEPSAAEPAPADEPVSADEPVPPVGAAGAVVDDEAHLAYLARLAFSQAGESIKARTPQRRVVTVGSVVELDVFRARYRR